MAAIKTAVVHIADYRKQEYLDRHAPHKESTGKRRPFLLLLSPDTLQLVTASDASDGPSAAASLVIQASTRDRPSSRPASPAGSATSTPRQPTAKPLSLLHKLTHSQAAGSGAAAAAAAAEEASQPEGQELGEVLEEGQMLTFAIALSQVAGIERDERRIKVGGWGGAGGWSSGAGGWVGGWVVLVGRWVGGWVGGVGGLGGLVGGAGGWVDGRVGGWVGGSPAWLLGASDGRALHGGGLGGCPGGLRGCGSSRLDALAGWRGGRACVAGCEQSTVQVSACRHHSPRPTLLTPALNPTPFCSSASSPAHLQIYFSRQKPHRSTTSNDDWKSVMKVGRGGWGWVGKVGGRWCDEAARACTKFCQTWQLVRGCLAMLGTHAPPSEWRQTEMLLPVGAGWMLQPVFFPLVYPIEATEHCNQTDYSFLLPCCSLSSSLWSSPSRPQSTRTGASTSS